MFDSAAGWHCPSLWLSVGARPIVRARLLCLWLWTQAGLAPFGARFPSRALQTVQCLNYYMEGKQTKPLTTSASPVDAVFPLFDCI